MGHSKVRIAGNFSRDAVVAGAAAVVAEVDWQSHSSVLGPQGSVFLFGLTRAVPAKGLPATDPQGPFGTVID